jgi:hypothetical protein
MNANALWESLQSSLGGHIPQLLGALAIFVLGWLIAVLMRAAVRKSLGFAGVNHRFGQATGTGVDIEGGIALGLFWLLMLFTLVAVFNSLDLVMVFGPLAGLISPLTGYAPPLIAGGVLALVAWLVKALTQKLLDKTTRDEKLSEHAKMAPISESLSGALFWIVILLFMTLIPDALGMQSLMAPLSHMVDKTLAMLPNVVAAVVIGGIGWIVATVLRNVVGNLSRTAGVDKRGGSAGLAETVQLSNVIGLLVVVAVFLPLLIAAQDALKIKAIAGPATAMLNQMMEAVPRIVAAGQILVITWILASFASKLMDHWLSRLRLEQGA